MNQNRQIIKSGQLQAKVYKKKGTLLRKKKKSVFGLEEWVVLCVHDDRVPLLEWYSSRASIFTHEPQKVVDLLDCQFCQTNIGEARCFTIGFNDPDRVALEFASKNTDECESWVNYLCSTLKRLNCISTSENVYDPAPYFSALNLNNHCATNADNLAAIPTTPRSRSSPQLPRVLTLHDEIPLPAPSSPAATFTSTPVTIPINNETRQFVKNLSSPRNSTLERRTTTCTTQIVQRVKLDSESIENDMNENPPPLPPRKSTSLELESPLPMPNSNENTSDKYRYVHQYDFPISPNFQYDKLKFTKINEEIPDYNRISFRNGDSRLMSENVLFVPHTIHSESSSSGIESRLSVTSDPIQEVYNLLPPPPPRPPKTSYDHISVQSDTEVMNVHNERISYDGFDKVKTISILLTICIENIAFVEVGSKVFIAGWSEDKNSSLCGLIHIGDEIIQIGDVDVVSMSQLPALFYSQSIPGTPVRLKIRTLPHGAVYSLTKMDSDGRMLGIVLHKKKNKIADITPKSPAAIAQIPHRMSPYLYGTNAVMPVITEIDNVPLSLFTSNEQFFRRLEKFPPGTNFTMVLHPHDFIQLIKDQIKHIKNARKFIQDF